MLGTVTSLMNQAYNPLHDSDRQMEDFFSTDLKIRNNLSSMSQNIPISNLFIKSNHRIIFISYFSS